MSYPKFKICRTCYFQDREPTICEGCRNGNQYEAAELDVEALEELREISEAQRARGGRQ